MKKWGGGKHCRLSLWAVKKFGHANRERERESCARGTFLRKLHKSCQCSHDIWRSQLPEIWTLFTRADNQLRDSKVRVKKEKLLFWIFGITSNPRPGSESFGRGRPRGDWMGRPRGGSVFAETPSNINPTHYLWWFIANNDEEEPRWWLMVASEFQW